MNSQAIDYLSPWHHSQQTLNYLLSDKTLFRAKLTALVCQLSLNNPPCDPVNFNALPKNIESEKVDGFIAWGACVNQDVKTVQVSNGLIVYIPQTYNRFYARLDQSFDDYKKLFKSKSRSSIQRKANKFAKLSGGEIDFRTYTTEAEVKEFLKQAVQLSEKTYQTKLLDAGLPTDDEYQAHLIKMAGKNKVRAFLLFKEGKPISYLLLDAEDDTLLYRYLGYDQNESAASPGTVLHWLAIEYLTNEGEFKYLDFTEGEGQQKRTFGTDSIYCANVYWLKKSLKNLILVYSHIALNNLSKSLGNMLDSLGIKARLKKILRRNG